MTDAIGGWVRVRMLMTARDAPTLFDLRCLVREHMVCWVRDHPDGGMPRQRVESVAHHASRAFEPVDDRREGGLFHGDAAADERARRLGTGSMPQVTDAATADAAGDADAPDSA